MHELNLRRVNYIRLFGNLLFVIVFLLGPCNVPRFKDYLFKLTTNHNASEGAGKIYIKTHAPQKLKCGCCCCRCCYCCCCCCRCCRLWQDSNSMRECEVQVSGRGRNNKPEDAPLRPRFCGVFQRITIFRF